MAPFDAIAHIPARDTTTKDSTKWNTTKKIIGQWKNEDINLLV